MRGINAASRQGTHRLGEAPQQLRGLVCDLLAGLDGLA
jgi:hypothetical protein